MAELYVALGKPLAEEEIRSRSWRSGKHLALISVIIGCGCTALWALGKDQQVADMDPTISMAWTPRSMQQATNMQFMQRIPNRNFMQPSQAPNFGVPVRRIEVYGGDPGGSFAKEYAAKFMDSGAAVMTGGSSAPKGMPSLEGLSPEQQAFMRRKYGLDPMPGSSPAPAPAGAPAPADVAPGQYSPEQLAFLERKKRLQAGGNPELEDVCEFQQKDVMTCDMEGLSPEQQAFMRRKLGLESMDGGLDTHGRPRR